MTQDNIPVPVESSAALDGPLLVALGLTEADRPRIAQITRTLDDISPSNLHVFGREAAGKSAAFSTQLLEHVRNRDLDASGEKLGEVVRELLQELHAFYLPLAEENQQRLELDIAPQVSTLRGDRELLFEALANLLSNALRFTPAHGRVLLRAVDDNGSLRIDVIDDGPGIAPQDRAHVYQRFFRGQGNKGRDEGFGLGLSIVAAIAGLHGFRMRTGSAPSGGAWLSIRCVTEGLL